MTPAQWRQIVDLCDATQRLNPEERATLLQSADPSSRSVVEGLLGSEGTVTRPMIGPYKVTGILGTGGMGTVFSGIDTRLGRSVAIKFSAMKYSDRFRREALAISTLNHPNICTLYDVGVDYLVMEHIQGCTLAEEIRKGPLPPAVAIRYASQIAGALAEAHAKGVIHRDLKPGNIMLTPHGPKVLDFGLTSVASEPGLTAVDTIMGTPAYMAPEQAAGATQVPATDLFALGVLLYEMLTGQLPIADASLGRQLISGSKVTWPAASSRRAGVPPEVDAVIAKLLAKDLADRYHSAAAVISDLEVISNRFEVRQRPFGLTPRRLAAVAVLLLLAVGGGALAYYRARQQTWVREEAIPQIEKLASNQPLAAFLLLQEASGYAPNMPRLKELQRSLTSRIAVDSDPPGANVQIQDYMTPKGAWLKLGVTPMKSVIVPNGYFRWRLTRAGSPEFLSAPETDSQMRFELPPDPSSGMLPVAAGMAAEMIDFTGFITANLPAFDVDQYEVTNAQYQTFLDQGGYRKQEFWKEKFVDRGKPLSWADAMERFRDSTGRPGPSTWEGGHFPTGKGNYPVSGVSWYEASAYAVFSGKQLPTLIQWYVLAPSHEVRYRISQSNFDKGGPVPVVSAGGVAPSGAIGLNGNVREWISNMVDGDRRFILGGAWRSQTYLAYDPEALPPFDRSDLNGFRCVRNKATMPPEALAPIRTQQRDFAHVKPASDEVFRTYQRMYAYDKTPINAVKQGLPEETADWIRQKVEYDAGYRNERLPAYLFLPKNVRAPYQAVLFYPSARVNDMPSSSELGDLGFVDYVIKSGRVLLYPIYSGTYERNNNRNLPGTAGSLGRIIENSKEVGRSLDYLASRPDIDKSKFAYIGVSQGAAEGVIYTALEPRFKTAVFLDGGFFLCDCGTGQDQVDFAPRLKIPVLMMNGRYDFTFSLQRAQQPMFQMLGTPAADKRHVVFDTPHDISQQKGDLSREVLAWLDKYLGKVE